MRSCRDRVVHPPVARAPVNRSSPQVRLRLLRGRQGPEGPARRQGRQPRRDDEPRAAGPARVHDHHRGLPGLPGGGPEPAGLADEVSEHLAALEDDRWARRSASPDDPLLVSVRSGAKFSMPGMMETVLNVGLNDESVHGLAAQAGNERFALDSYRRLIQMFGNTVLGIDGGAFEEALDAAQASARATTERPRPGRRGPARSSSRRSRTIVVEHAGRDVPAGPARAAGPGGPRGLRLVEHRARGALPAPGADPRTTSAPR